MAHSAPLTSVRHDPRWSKLVRAADETMARVLFVTPQPAAAVTPVGATADGSPPPFGTPLLVSAVRCIIRYVVLPFVLPFLGIATGAAFSVGLLLDVIAAVSIVMTLRQLWRLQHPRRWHYIPLAAALVVTFSLFLIGDYHVLHA